MKEKISIVIPTMASETTFPYLVLCLKSFEKTKTVDHDIIIAENPTTKENSNLSWRLSKEGLPVTTYRFVYSNQQGQCIATNKAVRSVKTKAFMFCNDDMVFPPMWDDSINTITSYMACGLNVMESTPVNTYSFTRHVQFNEYGRTYDNFDIEGFWKEAKEYYLMTRRDRLHKGVCVPYIIHKELWDTVGGLKEEYDPWGSNSESDLFYKILLTGANIRVFHPVVLYHFAQKSGTFTPQNYDYWLRNRAIFKNEWGFHHHGQMHDIDSKTRIFHPEWEGIFKGR